MIHRWVTLALYRSPPAYLPKKGLRTRMIGNLTTLRTGSLTIPKHSKSGKLIHLHLTTTISLRHLMLSLMSTLPCDSSSRRSDQTFLYHSMIQTNRLYSADDLYMLWQGEDEPLREYAARFNHDHKPPFNDPPQSAQNPKRKDDYLRSFNNGKRGRHFNHHQSRGNNPLKTNDRASFPFEPKPKFEVFTTLNTTYEKVLVNEAPIIPKPLPRRPTNKPMPNTGVLHRSTKHH
ncbi:unnamed protein product [Prunus brigantina]